MGERSICIYCGEPLDDNGRCPRCGRIGRVIVSKPELERGKRLNKRYQISRVLGSGGFGITYMAKDYTLNMTVAIKECFPKRIVTRNEETGEVIPNAGAEARFQQEKERFLQEARSLVQLRNLHNIVDVQDFFEDNNTAYIVMEHIRGVSLYKLVKDRGYALSVKEMLQYIIPVLDDLEVVHEKGVIHKDISPDNIMIMGDLNNYNVKLIDFGAAQDLSEESSEKNQYKRGYAPIEQYRNESDLIGPWTDVYAVCATIYWLLSGQRLPDASERRDKDKAYSLKAIGVMVPDQLEKVLEKGLAYSPQKRIDSIGKLKKMLKKVPTAPYAKAWAGSVVLTVACAGLLAYSAWTANASNLQSYQEKKEAAMTIDPKITVTADLTGQKDNVMWSRMKAVVVSDASASSEATSTSGKNFSAENVINSDLSSVWGEGVDGAGIGEKLTLNIGEVREIRAIQANLGDWSDPESYERAGRPKALKITAGEQHFEITDIPDKQAEVYIVFSEPVKTSDITFEIEDVYEGAEDYTCISEIDLFEMK